MVGDVSDLVEPELHPEHLSWHITHESHPGQCLNDDRSRISVTDHGNILYNPKHYTLVRHAKRQRRPLLMSALWKHTSVP